jgi:hypothetical protein
MILADNDEMLGKITPPISWWGGSIEDIFGKLGAYALRIFIVIAGIVTLIFLLKGSLDWITSGGDKEKVTAARNTLTHAIIGLALIFVVIAGVAAVEKLVFGSQFCFGLTCPIEIPTQP